MRKANESESAITGTGGRLARVTASQLQQPMRVFVRALVLIVALVTVCGVVQPKGKTVYVHLLNGDDTRGDGNYTRPFKSWRFALRHVGSGDTIIAKNGDYREDGPKGSWGGLNLDLTMADQLEAGDPRQPVPQGARTDTIGIYRYDPANPLTIRAEIRQSVVIDHIRFHLARGIVIDGFDIFPNPYYTHHITVEDCELFDGKNFQRKPAIDLPCSDDVVVRRNLIRNCHRGVVSKGGGFSIAAGTCP